MTDLKHGAAKLSAEAQSGLSNFGHFFGVDLKPYILCSLFFWGMRVLSKPAESLRMHLYDLFFSVPLGTIVGAMVMEYLNMPFLSMGASSMAALLARDWVTALLSTGWGKKLDAFLDTMLANLADRFKKD